LDAPTAVDRTGRLAIQCCMDARRNVAPERRLISRFWEQPLGTEPLGGCQRFVLVKSASGDAIESIEWPAGTPRPDGAVAVYVVEP
jgi:hypothetical protein